MVSASGVSTTPPRTYSGTFSASSPEQCFPVSYCELRISNWEFRNPHFEIRNHLGLRDRLVSHQAFLRRGHGGDTDRASGWFGTRVGARAQTISRAKPDRCARYVATRVTADSAGLLPAGPTRHAFDGRRVLVSQFWYSTHLHSHRRNHRCDDPCASAGDEESTSGVRRSEHGPRS